MKSVEEVLLDIVDLCDELQLEYVILGGIAVRVHGIPRPTYDVDFQMSADESLLDRFFDQAEARSYEISSIYRTGWRDEVGAMPLVKMHTFLAAGQSVDVDIFINETAFQNSLMRRRLSIEFEGRQLFFVTPEDLILLKLIANRPRDLGDVGDILFTQGQLDELYMKGWAVKLNIPQRLEQALHND